MSVFFISTSSAWAQFTLYNSSNSNLTDNACWYVNQNAAGDVWVATLNNGAFKLSGNSWTNYNPSNSTLSSYYITPIQFDNSGNVWLGSYTNNKGIFKFSSGVFTNYNTTNSSLPHNDVLAIVVDNQNNKWIGTRGGGLAKYDGTTWTLYNTSNSGISSNIIYSLEVDGNGNIWVGTALNGLCKFNGTTWTTYNTSNSQLLNNDIYALKYNSSTNSLWIGTNGGLNILNGTTWSSITTTNTTNFPGNYIRGIAHHYATGKTYVASGSGGIGVYNGNNWQKFNTANSNLPSNQIWSINLGNTGTLWASTIDAGIVKMELSPTFVKTQPDVSQQLSIFPNPANTSDALNISLATSVSGSADVSILNSLGQKVLDTQVMISPQIDNYQLPTNPLSPGIYMLSVQAGKSAQTIKFIVQ